jgi:hypothetical protein
VQTLIDYGAIALTWSVAAFIGIGVLKNHRNRRAATLWLLTLSASSIATFQVDAIYTAVDSFFGVNNLSWLLSYLSLTLTVYFLCSILGKLARWTRLYLIVTVTLLVVIFPFGPGSTAEITDHVTLSNVPELLFTGSAYSYAIAMMGVVLPGCTRSLRSERETHVRLRTYATVSILTVSILFYVAKLVAYTSGFFFSSLPSAFLHTVTDTAKLLVAGAIILWPLIFATNGFYQALARPAAYLKKLDRCWALGELQVRLDALSPSPASDDAPWWEWSRNPDFYIYRRMISTLDRKKALAAWIEHPGQETEGTFTLSIEEATRLYQGLERISTSESSDLDHVMDTCHRLSRQILRGKP